MYCVRDKSSDILIPFETIEDFIQALQICIDDFLDGLDSYKFNDKADEHADLLNLENTKKLLLGDMLYNNDYGSIAEILQIDCYDNIQLEDVFL